ncbi:MAG TPA: hypothetical protein GXX34_05705 [Clostridia bacterium]|nr:hypothetical protein [Clostridia bacterium]
MAGVAGADFGFPFGVPVGHDGAGQEYVAGALGRNRLFTDSAYGIGLTKFADVMLEPLDIQ